MSGGAWQEESVVGAGSFGSVRVWRQAGAGSGRRVALKLVGPLPLPFAQRWLTELQMLSSITSPNIITALKMPDQLAAAVSAYNTARLPVLCTEYCNGGSLRQYLNNIENINGVPEPEVRCILSDLKNAVSYLHTIKIVHKDLKPENVGLCPVDSDPHRKFIYKLTDLGHTKDVDTKYISDTFTGPLQYYSPELLESKTVSVKTDFWSLGLIAFEISCGYYPFLPSMTPSERMLNVNKKNSAHICLYQDWKDNIIQSTEIFKENHISNCFKSALEKWIRLALELDPLERGKPEEKMTTSVRFSLPDSIASEMDDLTISSKNTEIFSVLGNTLDRKILKIFSIPTYERLSYEIDDGTMFITLQRWIERDTQIPIDEQLFITSDIRTVDLHSLVLVDSDVTFYLHKRGKHHNNLSCLKPDISFKIQRCLENPRTNLHYYHMHDTLASIYFFISNEDCLYRSLINGTGTRIEYLNRDIKNLDTNNDALEKSINKLIEKSELLSKIVDCDKNKIANLPSDENANKLQTWIGKCDSVQNKVEKLKSCRLQLTTRLDSVKRRCNEILNKSFYCQEDSEFSDLLKTAADLISRLRLIPKNERIQANCADPVKLIYKCIKIRDKTLFNLDNRKIFQIILDIQIESEKMSGLIDSIDKNAVNILDAIKSLILEKQDLMWELYESRYSGKSSENNSLTHFKIGELVRCPKSSLTDVKTIANTNTESDSKLIEFHSLIKDSLKLIKDSDNVIKKSHNIIKDEVNRSILGID